MSYEPMFRLSFGPRVMITCNWYFFLFFCIYLYLWNIYTELNLDCPVLSFLLLCSFSGRIGIVLMSISQKVLRVERTLFLVSFSSLDNGHFEESWNSALLVIIFEILTWGLIVQGPIDTNAMLSVCPCLTKTLPENMGRKGGKKRGKMAKSDLFANF